MTPESLIQLLEQRALSELTDEDLDGLAPGDLRDGDIEYGDPEWD